MPLKREAKKIFSVFEKIIHHFVHCVVNIQEMKSLRVTNMFIS